MNEALPKEAVVMPHSPLTKISSPPEYVIDQALLLALFERKIINLQAFVFFAIKIEFPGESHPEIDIYGFCDKWGITQANFYQAIAQLQKKEALAPIATQLQLSLFDDDTK